MSLFCRHNRLTAECPICVKGTVLDPDRKPARRPRPATGSRTKGGAKRARGAGATTVSRGPFVSAGPYRDGREVRLERVPGGLRFAAWHAGQIAREPPELALGDLPGLLGGAVERGLFGARELATLRPALGADASGTTGAGEQPARAATSRGRAVGEPGGAPLAGSFGGSPGRTGELRDELRVERVGDERLRIARWILRPGAGWELQQAPVLLPAARFAQALAAAAGKGVLVSGPAPSE